MTTFISFLRNARTAFTPRNFPWALSAHVLSNASTSSQDLILLLPTGTQCQLKILESISPTGKTSQFYDLSQRVLLWDSEAAFSHSNPGLAEATEWSCLREGSANQGQDAPPHRTGWRAEGS